MRPSGIRWQLWVRRCGLALAAAMLLTACAEDPEPELSGHFGPGSGGDPVDGPYTTVPITKSSGTIVGYADYDNDYFSSLGPTNSGEFDNLVDMATGAAIGINLTRITGRPDTPCRFQAAILARDEGYDIKESGDRQNSRNLDFYQVNLKKGGTYLSLFCVTLRDDVGTAVQVITGDGALIRSLQVHYLLNSIRKS